MKKLLLVTGASGAFGQILVPLLVEQFSQIVLLNHTSIPSFSSVSVTHLRGDITQKHLGLSETEYDHLRHETTDIIHAAADTHFNIELETIRQRNVGGTKQIIEFAQQCPSLHHVGYISTAYVAGKRTGAINENELTHSEGFVNTYEQSKYEAEQVINENKMSLPFSIYRLTTLLCDDETGKVSRFIAPHIALRLMYLGLASMIAGDAKTSIDVLPINFAAKCVAELFRGERKFGTTFQITGSPDKSWNLKTFLRETMKAFARHDPSFLRRDVTPPSIVSAETFRLFMEAAIAAKNPIIQQALETLSSFGPQLTFPKQFDHTQVLKNIPDYESMMPSIDSYFDPMIKYCITTRWGTYER